MIRPAPKIDSERDCFEIDRGALIDHLYTLKLAIQHASNELAMIAAENVFDQPLSARLKRKARALDRMAVRLDVLGAALARAKFPRAKK